MVKRFKITAIAGAAAFVAAPLLAAEPQVLDAASPKSEAQGGQATETAHAAPHWGYEGAGGPANWGSLSADYVVCKDGREQSPVDLANPLPAQTGRVSVNWQTSAVAVVNNGHTIQVNPVGAFGTMQYGGKAYELLQFHFHHMSEHTRHGRASPMEVHFVHKATDGSGDLAVVGMMIEQGHESTLLQSVWSMMPEKAGASAQAGPLEVARLLPLDLSHVNYMGSLTTPPCSEVVTWIVLDKPLSMSAEQIAAFAKLFPNNARPVQAVNRRFLLRTN